eukprot:SAG31_NODE_4765_length_2970_cov_21.015640_1_plen_69_part_00
MASQRREARWTQGNGARGRCGVPARVPYTGVQSVRPARVSYRGGAGGRAARRPVVPGHHSILGPGSEI